MRVIIITALAVLSLCLPVQARTAAESRTLFIQIAEDHGCKMSEKEGRAVMPKYGMSMDESEPIVGAMLEEGTATFSKGILRLTGDICHSSQPKAPTASAADAENTGDKFLRLVRENGCSMTEEQAEAILTLNGIDLKTAEDILEVWVKLKQATFDGDALVLNDVMCGGNRDALPKEHTFSEAGAQLLFLIQRNGCRMSEREAEAQLPEIGLDIRAADDILKIWVAKKLADIMGNNVVLAPSQCQAFAIDESDTEARKKVFVALIEMHGCAMTEDTAKNVLPAAGFETKDETKKFVQEMMASGEAELKDNKLTLITENCR